VRVCVCVCVCVCPSSVFIGVLSRCHSSLGSDVFLHLCRAPPSTLTAAKLKVLLVRKWMPVCPPCLPAACLSLSAQPLVPVARRPFSHQDQVSHPTDHECLNQPRGRARHTMHHTLIRMHMHMHSAETHHIHPCRVKWSKHTHTTHTHTHTHCKGHPPTVSLPYV